jgi:SAM-dependent methyltransferase
MPSTTSSSRAPGATDGAQPQARRLRARANKIAGQKGATQVDYRVGDALWLPYGDAEFDVAVMALVIGYLPDRLKALSELKRVVRRGGTVATYVWDGPESGHPQQPLIDALGDMGIELSVMHGDQDRPIGALKVLFEESGLVEIDTRTIEIQQSFTDFDEFEFWSAQNALGNRFVQAIRNMSATDLDRFKTLLRKRLLTATSKSITYAARANAIKGYVPT